MYRFWWVFFLFLRCLTKRYSIKVLTSLKCILLIESWLFDKMAQNSKQSSTWLGWKSSIFWKMKTHLDLRKIWRDVYKMYCVSCFINVVNVLFVLNKSEIYNKYRYLKCMTKPTCRCYQKSMLSRATTQLKLEFELERSVR